MIGYHSNTRLKDKRIIAPTVAHRRLVARTVLEQSDGIVLLSFSAADTHLHFEIAGSQAQASEMMRRFKIAWRKRTKVPIGFDAAWHEPVQDQSHLYAAFKYVLTQDLHHECRVDPYFEATVLPDLLGMRVINNALVDNVRSFLPRVGPAYLLEAVGLSRETLGRLTLADISLDHLVEAAAAAVALPDISGQRREAISARAAAVEVASRFIGPTNIARHLKIGVSSVKRLRSVSIPPALVRAIELQLRFRKAVELSIERQPLEERRWSSPPSSNFGRGKSG